MNRLAKIAQTGEASARLQFRRRAYGAGDIRSFLRDVIALANADVEGPRHIVVGVDLDGKGRRHFHAVKTCAIDPAAPARRR